MATERVRYVNTASAGGGDGTTNGTGAGGTNAFADWATAFTAIETESTNFVTDDVYYTLRCTGTVDSASAHTFSSTMDSTRYLQVVPNTAGDQNFTAIYDESYYTLETTVGNSGAIGIHATAYVIFDGIQFKTNNTSGTQYTNIFRRATSGGTLIVRNFKAKFGGTWDTTPPSATETDTMYRQTGAQTTTFANGVVEGFQTGITHQTTVDGTLFVNVLFKDCTNLVAHGSTGRIKFKNCLVEGATNWGSTEVASGSDYNSCNLATPPTNWGTNSLDTQAVTFRDEAGGDYRLSAADSALLAGVGTTDSDVPSTDIRGVDRASSTAAMGAYEYAGSVYINDATTLDGGEVSQTYPGTANWSDTSINVQTVPDTTGLTPPLYVIVETASGGIAYKAVTVGASGPTITDVNGTESWTDGDTGLVITGTDFI